MTHKNTTNQSHYTKDQKNKGVLQLSCPDELLILRLGHHHRHGKRIIAQADIFVGAYIALPIYIEPGILILPKDPDTAPFVDMVVKLTAVATLMLIQ